MTEYPPTKIPPWNHQEDTWELAQFRPYMYIPHDMGCLVGSTKINIMRAKKSETVTLAELYNLFHGINKTKRFRKEIPIYARALCAGIFRQHLIVGAIKNPPSRVIKLTLVSGKSVTLTPFSAALR